VKVVVTFAESHESGKDVIARRVAVVEWLIAEPVSQRIDAKCGLLHKENPEDSGVDESALPVTPAETTGEQWEDQAHEDDDFDVVAMLPDDDRVIIEIRDVGAPNALWVLFDDHPAKVRVEEALPDGATASQYA
jgi:hypothetical protein